MNTSLPRLWPWVLAGLAIALLILAVLAPIPVHPTAADQLWRCQSDIHC
jgi:hypothetical protein